MPNQRRGYVGRNEKSQWFARITITDESGKRRKIVGRAKDKSGARAIVKALTRELNDEGSKAVDQARLTFLDLADFYVVHHLKAAEFVNGRKVAGMKGWKHARAGHGDKARVSNEPGTSGGPRGVAFARAAGSTYYYGRATSYRRRPTT